MSSSENSIRHPDNRRTIALLMSLAISLPLTTVASCSDDATAANPQIDASPANDDEQEGPSEWTSAPCSTVALGPDDAEMSHLRRSYLLGPAGHTTWYRFFADEQCTLPLYSFVFIGGIEMGDPVPEIPDAVEATVTFDRILFTLESPRGMEAARDCADGDFAIGVQRDVSDSDCLFMKAIPDCGVDYDIVKIADGVATPGFRSADMCTPAGRPSKLQTEGARFVEQF